MHSRVYVKLILVKISLFLAVSEEQETEGRQQGQKLENTMKA